MAPTSEVGRAYDEDNTTPVAAALRPFDENGWRHPGKVRPQHRPECVRDGSLQIAWSVRRPV
jgi:hypothetical protein